MPDPAPLVVFSDDWGRHPSSCQHLVSHLLPTRPVVWVNTIGTRPPRLDRATVVRAVEKLKQWGRKPSDSSTPPLLHPSTPRVLNPRMWPSFRGRLARGLNRRLLGRAVRSAVADLPAPPVVVTTLPVTADLVGAFPAARWVYYCVDDFAAWPGLDGRTLRDMEAELVAKVDAAVAVSENLQLHLAKLGRPSHLLTHGVDLDHFRRAPATLPESLRGLEALPGPLVVFWGVIDRRMDCEFVRALAASLEAGTVVLVGPRDDPDPALLALPRVVMRPTIPYADLPALAARAAVLVMPYADLPVTRAMQPLKLKEYLATGKPVVVRELPATRDWGDCLDAVGTPAAFAAAVRERLRDGVPAAQAAARARLDAEGWAAKAARFAGWL